MNVVHIILQWIAAGVIVLGVVLLFTAKSLRPILRQALTAVMTKKYLWFIGIFAGIAAYGGEVNFLMQKVYDVGSYRDYITAIREIVSNGQANDLIQLLKVGVKNSPLVMAGYAALVVILVMIIYWLVIVSQGVIMRLSGRLSMQQPASFGDAVSTVITKFWDLLKVAIIFLLVGWGVWLILAGVPTMIYFLTNSPAWANIAELGSYISLVISFFNLFIVQFASATVVLLGRPAIDSIVFAWKLLIRNMLVVFELALVLFAANLLVLIIVASVLTFVFPLPTPTGFYITIGVLLLEMGLMSAFSFAAATELFVQLQNAAPESKLGQWTQRIVNLATAKKAV